jgi:hypothetical protein
MRALRTAHKAPTSRASRTRRVASTLDL